MEAAKAKPGSIRAGASASGSIHHLNLLALEKGAGVKFNYIPYPGSAPAQTGAMTGEVSVVVTSVAEQQQLISPQTAGPRHDDSRPFTMKDVGTIPSAFVPYPGLSKYLPIMQAIGFAVPGGVPEDVKNSIAETFKKAVASDAMKNWQRQTTMPFQVKRVRQPRMNLTIWNRSSRGPSGTGCRKSQSRNPEDS